MARPQVRWTSTQARKVLDDCAASGLTLAEFARQHELPAKRLYRWRERLNQTPNAPPNPQMIELVPTPATPNARLYIRCPSGHTLEMSDLPTTEALRLALAALAEVHPC